MSARRSVLVTGAGGFIGAHLVNRLASLGMEVRALDLRRPNGLAREGQVRVHQVDICDRRALAPLLEGVDTVFHLASLHLEVGADPAAFDAVNVHASADLVTLAAEQGVRRLVHTSSVGVYGDAGRGPPLSEDAPKHPDSPYERSKLKGETAVISRAHDAGLELVALRPAWVYGPGCPRTGKLLRALRKGRFFYIGPGDNRRHPLFIDEMIHAFLLAADAPGQAGGIYNIAGPRIMPLREMVETFASVARVRLPTVHVPTPLGYAAGWAAELAFHAVNREPPLSRRSLAFFRSHNAWDISAAQRELGFEPAIDLEEGIRRTLTGTTEQHAVVAT
ncbi:MAG TPA: NAD-dependent epimerase/dehydratase family protein [Gemmatimonadales bacterium]|nr:NAD-dependent epimerase/dehydratase family protein [Gemmatimonadales bacterium]